MKFRTEIDIRPYRGLTLTPFEGVISIGSCFAENIAVKMREALWEVVSPFSALYNPLSISKAINFALNSKANGPQNLSDNIFEKEGVWHTWLGDSSFSGRSPEEVEGKLRAASELFISSLKSARVLIVTFGTAWCYFLADHPEKIVANCHKVPGSSFIRRRISEEEIIAEWKPLLKRLKEENPELEIILTVSPVRHLKDGMTGNNLSKAILHLAVEDLCHSFDFCHYFPAYEIMMDDLRDYRFYASDLAHPSEEALRYIWEKFQECYLTEEGRKQLKEGESIRRGFDHRSILETPEERSRRLATLEKRKSELLGE